MRARSRRLIPASAVLALLVFGAAWMETGFVHEDDGCRVETHCLACRWAAGTTAVLAAAPALPVGSGFTEAVTPEAPALRGQGALRLSTSRGPPSA